MGILEDHQNRPLPRQGLKLVEHGPEQLLAFELRAKVEIGSNIGKRQQLCDQLDFIRIGSTGCEHPAEFDASLILALASHEIGSALELPNKWMKRTIFMVRRAEVAQSYVRFALDALGNRRSQP